MSPSTGLVSPSVLFANVHPSPVDGLPVLGVYDSDTGASNLTKCARPTCAGPSPFAFQTVVATSTGGEGGTTTQLLAFALSPTTGAAVAAIWVNQSVLALLVCRDEACAQRPELTAVGSGWVADAQAIAFAADGTPTFVYTTGVEDSVYTQLVVVRCPSPSTCAGATVTALPDVLAYYEGLATVVVPPDGMPFIALVGEKGQNNPADSPTITVRVAAHGSWECLRAVRALLRVCLIRMHAPQACRGFAGVIRGRSRREFVRILTPGPNPRPASPRPSHAASTIRLAGRKVSRTQLREARRRISCVIMLLIVSCIMLYPYGAPLRMPLLLRASRSLDLCLDTSVVD